jgi:hypothetical protein
MSFSLSRLVLVVVRQGVVVGGAGGAVQSVVHSVKLHFSSLHVHT